MVLLAAKRAYRGLRGEKMGGRAVRFARIPPLAVCILAIWFAATGARADVAPTYSIIEMGDFYPTSINDSGQVVGEAGGTSGRLYTNGQMIDLNQHPPLFSYSPFEVVSVGINNSGRIVGWATGETETDAFFLDGDRYTDVAQNSFATAINNSNQIVVLGGGQVGLYSGGQLTNLCAGDPYGINDSGQIVGRTSDGYAFLYSAGQLTNLCAGTAWSINNSGQIAGYSGSGSAYRGRNGNGTAFLYSDGQLTYFTLAGMSNSIALGINNFAQAVGQAWTPGYYSDTEAAILYSGSQTVDLNDLIPTNSGWQLLSATAINNVGQIVGKGNNGAGLRAFLLTPLPPTVSFTADPTNGVAWLTVNFTDTSTGSITNRSWSFGDGGLSSIANPTYTYSNAGVFTVSLTAFGFGGQSTLTQTNMIAVSPNNPPVITLGPSVTNALLQVGNLTIVIAGETNVFTVDASDADNGDSVSYQWSFGDGVTNAWSSSQSVEHVYGTNCGPYQVSVTATDGKEPITSNLTVTVACPLTVIKMGVKLNFAKTNSDSCSLTATLNLGAGYNLTNGVVLVDVGGTTNVTFWLDAKGKGKGVGSYGSCKLVPNKKIPGSATLTVKLAKGTWHTQWEAFGLVNLNVPKTPPTSVTMPVTMVIDANAFAGEHTMAYTAKFGKSGSAK